ncbi:hypothetical protein SNE40_005844 [Patella caerulea]|uniref:EF-hand domain-containing protein n=2 Tax=Patella caerulea TaxID=87958 RepID=A0AAN8K4E4_PATCE
MLWRIFIFTVCSMFLTASADVKPKTKAGIDTLFHLRRMFYVEDLDDDLCVEWDDIYQVASRADINNDGIYEFNEMLADPDMNEASRDDFNVFEVNGDGKVDMDDVHLKFYDILSASGNDVDIKEYLRFMSTREPDRGELMDIKSFVNAEKNFLVSDQNDNGLLSPYEYKAEFRFADADHDGFLNSNETDAFRPTRHVGQFCDDVATTGCSLNDVEALFDGADTDNSGKLSVEEYIIYFGKLMTAT